MLANKRVLRCCLQTFNPLSLNCEKYISFYWVVISLQLLFLLSTGTALATASVHTFRTTLFMQAAVCVSLPIRLCWEVYTLLQVQQSGGVIYDRWLAWLIGTTLAITGNLLLCFAADAM